MFFTKKTIVFFFVLIITGCTSSNFSIINPKNQKVITISTPSDRYNIIFREYLNRKFNNRENVKPDFILEASISFNSNETLSVSGSKVLNSTKAVIKYLLIDIKSNLLLKSGLIETFPALSSSSNSIYSNERSLENIKERLNKSSANKLYMLTNMTLRKLN
tara:strand:+ start:1235 stop:1717 length:483 start_codon:yes stop_codon:yes gene_type:complete